MKIKLFYCSVIFFVLNFILISSAYSQCEEIPIPMNPQNRETCEGNEIPALTVENPGSEYFINWYSEVIGGSLLESATNSYVPTVSNPGEYIYYAETEEIETGCKSDRIPVTLVIHQNPEVSIIPESYFCCAGATLNFDQNSSPSAVFYNWYFDGGFPSVSTESNPVEILFTMPGIYNVELTIQDENGCINHSVIEIYVNVFNAEINGNNGPVCFNTPAFNFTADFPGGVWSGAGITDSINGTFDPSIAGVGMHMIYYEFGVNQECELTNDYFLIVHDENVSPEINPVNSMFVDDEPIVLISNITGGVWSGSGITDSEAGVFDPSVAGIGLHTISYNVEFGACSGSAQTVIEVTGINVYGYLFNDLNTNCIFDAGEEVADRLIVAVPGPYYAYTNSSGYYKFFLDEGAYTIQAVEPAYFSVTCPDQGFQNIIVVNTQDTLQNVNLGMSPDFLCSLLNVELLLGTVRPCFSSQIYVNYSNTGTVAAENAYVEIELAPYMTYVSSTLAYSSFLENVYRYDLGNLDPFENGTFTITVTLACDLDLLGQTSCVTATIYPNSTCETDFGNWDHSSVSVDGYCQDNLNACFTITNTGDFGEGDMQNPHEYRIFANDTLVFTGTFQLLGGASTEICWATNGQAIRLEADQHPEHPGNSHPQFTVEACGENSILSYGHIITNNYDDDPQFIDIDCRIITGSYDPNNKEVQPSGITENHYIESKTLLTYRVNVQNTGTDTAFTVVIVDTLSSKHDILSFERGICSHPCEFEIYGNGILVWTFNNILLPDSAANEPESHGFVTYKVRTNEMSAAEYGLQILNNAAIYFDFNPPVITNTTQLVFWNLPLLPQAIPGLHLNLQFSIFPNPATQSFTVDTKTENCNLQIFDTNGKEVKEITNYNGEQITISDLSKGLYFVKLIANDKISVGKLVVE